MERVTLKPEEAADVLGIGVRTLQEWTADGFVPSIKRGGIRLYSVDALREWARDLSAYEEAGRGKAAGVGNGLGLQERWGRQMGRRGSGSPTSLRTHRTRGQSDAG